MNDLLEALHSLLTFILEDARAGKLDANHIEQERYRHLRVEMAKLADGLGTYLDQAT